MSPIIDGSRSTNLSMTLPSKGILAEFGTLGYLSALFGVGTLPVVFCGIVGLVLKKDFQR